MRISSPSRKINARNPSHFGSKIQVWPTGNSSIRLASIGSNGGFTGRFTLPTLRLRVVQNLPDSGRKLSKRERFGEQFDAAIESSLMHNSTPRVAARKEHPEMRCSQSRLVRQLAPIDSTRESNIGEQQFNIGPAFENPERPWSVGRLQH